MLNHVRTLLLNLSGETDFLSLPGEELIDSSYRPLTLAGPVKTVWELLYGPAPDIWMRLYRTRELLHCLHLPELEETTLSLDSRISYSLDTSPYYDPTLFQPRFSYVSGGAPIAHLIGDAGSHDSSGRLERKWNVRTVSAGEAVEATLQLPLTRTTTALVFDSGLSNLIQLPGSDLYFRLGEDPGETPHAWEVVSRVRPNRSLVNVVGDLSRAGGSVLADIFASARPEGQQEPLKTLRALWEDHYLTPYRLGGITLALALRMESLR